MKGTAAQLLASSIADRHSYQVSTPPYPRSVIVVVALNFRAVRPASRAPVVFERLVVRHTVGVVDLKQEGIWGQPSSAVAGGTEIFELLGPDCDFTFKTD